MCIDVVGVVGDDLGYCFFFFLLWWCYGWNDYFFRCFGVCWWRGLLGIGVGL